MNGILPKTVRKIFNMLKEKKKEGGKGKMRVSASVPQSPPAAKG